MRITRTIRRFAVAALTVGVLAAVSPPPAFAAVIHNDNVTISDPDIDFGGGSLIFGSPSGAGNLAYDDAGATMTVRLTGTLFMRTVGCGRMHMSFRDVFGATLQTIHGTPRCTGVASTQTFAINLGGGYSNPATWEVEVCTELESGGTYWQIGCQTEHLF